MPFSSWAAKPDRTPPTVPTGVTATAVSCSQVNLSWNASTDSGSGVKQYNISRNGVLIKTVLAPATSTSDTTVAGATTYSYTVSATDNKGNTSSASTPAGVTTPSCNNTTTYVTISLSASPSGAGAPSGGGSVVLNSTVTVSANPSSCYNFVSWTENGTVVSTSASYSFTATANRTLVANYSVKPYTVSVSSSAGGTASGGGTFNCGSTATVTATASSCYHFVNWTENGSVVSTSASYSFTVSANRTLVANFAINPYTISTGVSPASSGSTTGAGTYNCGSTVTVSATAAAGYTFANWTENGSVVSTSASYSFSASANRTLTANFTAATCSYTLGSTSASFSASGGSSSFGITAGSTCSWTASTTYSWITVNSSSGTGNGNVYYTVAANTSTSSRSGTITVAGQTVTISQAGAPAVSLTTPTSGSTISNTVATAANASSSSSIAKVEFYYDTGVLIGTATASPYSVNWNTTNVANGAHSVYAKAYDASGSATTSTANSVTVNNTTASAPSAPSGQLVWTRGITAYSVQPPAIAADHLNNAIVAGTFDQNPDFGGGTISYPGWGGFIAKYDSSNHLLWTRVIGNNTAQAVAWIYGLAVDSQNNIIVIGYFGGGLSMGGTVDFGGITGTAIGYYDIFVAKYSSAGSLLWVKTYGRSGGNNKGRAVAVDANDNIVVAASFWSTIDFGGLSLTSSTSGTSIALLKLSGSTGGTIWGKTYGTSANDIPNALAVDSSGNVLVTGSTAGSSNLGGGAIGNGGVFVAKYYGVDGSYLWARVASGTAGYGIAADASTGNVFVTGGFSGSVDFGGGLITSDWNGGIFIVGYDSSGNYLWAKAYGQPGDSGYGIVADGNGHLAVADYDSGGIDFGGTGMYSSWNYLMCFTVSGNSAPVFQWAANNSTASGVAFDSAGHVLVAGASGSAGFASQFTK